MDSKAYDLLEKLYLEIQEIKANMVVKDDIKDIVIKDDLKNLSTKEDLNLLGEELRAEIQMVYDELKELRNDLNTMEILTTKNAFDIAKLKSVR